MNKINMIDEKYIEKICVDDAILGSLRSIMSSKRITIKKLSELDETLNYGYLRQIFQGNHSVVSYSIIKKICDCLNVDVAMIYSGNIKYNDNKILTA